VSAPPPAAPPASREREAAAPASRARPPLVLASASPRRLALLGQLGIVPNRVLSTDLDETPKRDELPRACAQRLARAKAEAARATAGPEGLILAADTVVALGRRILPKAETEAEARRCLSLLSGRRHRVLTAVVLLGPDGRRSERLAESTVGFARLTEAQLASYLAGGEWHDKAGGYAIQGFAAGFIRFLSGSYSNVVGLPLFETAQMLRGQGWLRP
jgi:nucleoside triphosphate pyrophosphatase